jgi:cytochrome d ubiquinol oxidase subunit II
MSLHTLWFIVLAILWVGFFVLEGFDLGVGALHAVVGRTDTERRVAINTIGPWWDGNEVWLIVAGAGTFAAFPTWYGTWFSALYLAVVLLLVSLMARGVSLEFRGKRDDPQWRRAWTWCLTGGSLLIPLLLGIALGDLLAGLPINSEHDFTGNFFDLFSGYGVWTGFTLLSLCLLHGCTFLRMRTGPPITERAGALARPLGWAAIAFVVGFVVFTRVEVGETDVPEPVQVLAIIAVIFAARLVTSEHAGWAFTASAVAIAATVGSLFIDLYPHVMVSSTSAANDLTVSNAASGSYALKVMTIVTVIFLPLVLAYQAWSFYVFRARVLVPKEGTPRGAPAPGASADGPAVPPDGPAAQAGGTAA